MPPQVMNQTGSGVVSPTHLQQMGHIRLVVPGHANTLWIFFIPIRIAQTGEDFMTRIHEFLVSADYRNSPGKPRGLLFRVFVEETIHIADLSSFRSSLSDIEANTNATEVIVTNHALSEDLTAVFRRPTLMRDSPPFVELVPDVMLNSGRGRAILLNHRTKNVAIAIALTIIVWIWLLVALIYGLIRRDVETGCAIAGVGVGVMAVIAAIIAWLRK